MVGDVVLGLIIFFWVIPFLLDCLLALGALLLLGMVKLFAPSPTIKLPGEK